MTLNLDILILCGGLGTRLRSATGETPKVMASIGEHPFLDILLEYLVRQGCRRVVLCTGYKAQEIESYYRQKKLSLIVDFSRELAPLGTGGALKNAKEEITTSQFMVLNGDSFCPVRLTDLIEFHNSKKALASVVLTEVLDSSDFGQVTADSENRITAFKEKTGERVSAYINAGIYCFDQKIFDVMPKDKDVFSMERDVFPSLIGRGFFGFKVKEDFIDIGTPERYNQAQQLLRKAGF